MAFKVFSNLPSESQIEITFFEGQSLTKAYGLNKFKLDFNCNLKKSFGPMWWIDGFVAASRKSDPIYDTIPSDNCF